MTFSPRTCRRLMVLGVAILVVVTLMLALGVIPAVMSDTYPRAAPERAARAFWANVGIAVVAAVVLFFGGVRLTRRGRLARALLVFVGIVVLLAGLALVDATVAFGSHGPHMSTARVFMACGAIGEIMAGILVIVAASRRIDHWDSESPAD